ncbi:Crp/Fnr family transcriptional regulator [Streptomyces sp. NPDC006739]|uniref:Crp/Fnr family transcriptional regulator n=1 Tax=Streptomyces sp. NPDC006739 TaxID=3364763 RepID=UPI0036B80529
MIRSYTDNGDVNDSYAMTRAARPGWPAHSFLSRLEPHLLGELSRAGELMEFHRTQPLAVEGGTETDVFLLLSSCVKVTGRLPRGGDALLAVRVGGDIVGELAALDRKPRSATVTACGNTPVRAVRVTRQDFVGILASSPPALLQLGTAVAEKLRTSTRRRVDYGGVEPHVRLARVLTEMADDHGTTAYGRSIVIGVDLTQVEWGTLIGVSTRTAERAIGALRDRKLIGEGRGRVTVLDMEGLRALAYPRAGVGV